MIFHRLSSDSPPCVHSGLCSGRLAGRLGDVCQEAAGHGPARESDGGGGPPARLPQPVPARQGDGGRLKHLCGANKRDLPAAGPAPWSSQETKVGQD